MPALALFAVPQYFKRKYGAEIMNRHYHTVILGASFYGCGRAAIRPGALVLEPAILAGSDCVFGGDAGRVPIAAPNHPLALEFYEELLRRRALTASGLQIAALAPLISRWCLSHELEIVFSCDILEYGHGVIEFMTVAGPANVTVDTIIDARPQYRDGKFLTALLEVEKPLASGQWGEFELTCCEPASRMSLRFALESDCSWPEARRRFREAWRQRPPELSGATLLWSGSRFLSAEFGNPLLALEAGLNEVPR